MMKCVAMILGLCVLAVGQGKDRPDEGKLKVGDGAPDFKLKRLILDEKDKDKDDKEKNKDVKLSDFKGKKPVLLVFGSYT